MRNFIQTDISLKNFNTFGVGGRAKYYICVKSIQELLEAFSFVRESGQSFFILGNGSNVLFDDKGFNGVIIHNKIDFCQVEKNKVQVGSGYLLPKLSWLTIKRDLAGLECFCGIPGSIGGALYMNAAAEGKNLSSLLEEVSFMGLDGKIFTYKKEEIEFAYRFSSFQKIKGAIISATFLLTEGDKTSLEEKRKFYLSNREKNQPLNKKSAGCIFKNPKGYFAGKLIEECSLKGMSIGGAKISTKHANFIVNDKDALAKDVLSLITLVKKKVQEKAKVKLEEELLYIPYQDGKNDGISS